MRFAGIKNNQICLISNTQCNSSDMKIIQVPVELDHLSSVDLLNQCRISGDKIILKKQNKPANRLKIAFISNYKMKCGISSYGEDLLNVLIPYVGDIKLFVEENEDIVGDYFQIGDHKLPANKIVTCWKRGNELSRLVKEIKEYSPDIVVLNHEWGIFPDAKYFLSLMSQLADYRVIVIEHSVFHHQDKSICEAAMPEIIVHSQEAEYVLKQEKKVSAKVHIITHGCPPPDPNKLWNFYKSEHTFVQAGFGLRYKGFEKCIQATAILKQKYSDVFCTIVFTDSSHGQLEHQIYYNELINLVDKLGLQNQVGIIKGYQSDEVLDAYYKTNKVAVFPYISEPQHEVFGASGAARVAMSKCMPVITSTFPHFLELPTVRADTPEEIAHQLDILFSDKNKHKNQIERQNKFLEDNSWQNIAKKYIKIFENY